MKLNNLHQIHMERVYANVFNSSGVELNLIEMGAMHPFLQIIGNVVYATKACEGFTQSKGWQQLQNYPDNFVVSFLSNTLFFTHSLTSSDSVSFSYPRLSSEFMSSCIFESIQLSTNDWDDCIR